LTTINITSIQIIDKLLNALQSWEQNYRKELKDIYDESGLQTLFTEYTRKVNIISAFIFSVTLIVSVAVNEIILHLVFIRNLISSLAISMSFSTITLIIGHIKPIYQRNQNKNYLENVRR